MVTVNAIYTIRCEFDRCYVCASSDERNIRAVRRVAKNNGWTFAAGKDFCRNHGTSGKATETKIKKSSTPVTSRVEWWD